MSAKILLFYLNSNIVFRRWGGEDPLLPGHRKQKSQLPLVELLSTIIHSALDAEVGCPEGSFSLFTFHIENHEPFGSLTKNCPKLDKNKSIVSSFSVFVVYKSTVSTAQKSNYVGCFNFRQ